MQVLVNCEDPICCDEELIRRIEGVIEGTLARFGDRVFRVEAHLSDLGSLKPGDRDKVCSLEARIAGPASVVARHEAATLTEAIHDAADKLRRFVARELERLDAALDAPQARPSAPPL
jgi:ribosome-associated translation inhibitor RaiA